MNSCLRCVEAPLCLRECDSEVQIHGGASPAVPPHPPLDSGCAQYSKFKFDFWK